MKKFLLIASLIASLFVMSACDSMDGPSPLDTAASSGSQLGGEDLSDSLGGANAMSDGLQERGFNQYAISSAERGNVKKAAAFFKANPNMKVYLVGHTDWYGTEEYNMLLSDKRCKSVQDYMLGLGMNSSKIETVARGEQGAVVDVAKDSPEAKHDRRVDIVKMR